MFFVSLSLVFILKSKGFPNISHNITNGKGIVVNKREVTLKCYPGYFLSTETNHFFCKDDGTWNFDELNPKCIKSKSLSDFRFFKLLFLP